MKNWKLTLLAAAAALGLQACDVSVNEKPAEPTASTTEPMPAPTASTDSSSLPPATTAAAPATAAPEGSLPPADTSTMAAQTPPPASPDTGAMGAPGATGSSMPAAAADGTAADTELGRFVQENPVKPRDPQAADTASDAGKSSAKAEGAAKGSKS